MAWRWLEVVGLQVLLAVLAWWLWGAWGALAGVVIATWLCMLWDQWQVRRLRRWLMAGDFSVSAGVPWVLGMIATYVRRAVRSHDQVAAAA